MAEKREEESLFGRGSDVEFRTDLADGRTGGCASERRMGRLGQARTFMRMGTAWKLVGRQLPLSCHVNLICVTTTKSEPRFGVLYEFSLRYAMQEQQRPIRLPYFCRSIKNVGESADTASRIVRLRHVHTLHLAPPEITLVTKSSHSDTS